MKYDELSDEELRQLLKLQISHLSDEDCRSILTEQNVAEHRAS